MYKKQMVFEKITCMFALISAAVLFIYSLGMMTDLYDSLYLTMTNPNDLSQTSVPGSIIYYDMQPFNKSLLHAAIALILIACLLFVTNNHVRRKYYLGNYVSSILYAVAAVGISIWSHIQIAGFKNQYLTTIDFDALKEFAELWSLKYNDSTFFLDLHYVPMILCIVSAAMVLYNLYWKKNMMDHEKAALAATGEAA